jgi:hypothetical protein
MSEAAKQNFQAKNLKRRDLFCGNIDKNKFLFDHLITKQKNHTFHKIKEKTHGHRNRIWKIHINR